MIRRSLTRILMVTLIAACGFNAWQVHRLQEQVQRLQSRTTLPRAGTGSGGDADTPAVSRSWLEQADLHAARARTAALRADLPTAQRELQRGVDDIHRAVREPEEQTQATLRQARHTLTALQGQADTLWRKVHTAPTAP